METETLPILNSATFGAPNLRKGFFEDGIDMVSQVDKLLEKLSFFFFSPRNYNTRGEHECWKNERSKIRN